MQTQVTAALKDKTLILLKEYQQTASPDTRNRLVKLNLGLVRREAHRWLACSDETFDDLMQVGSLGLIRAIERFDLAKGYAFSSFAIPYIRGEIQHYLRDKGCSVRIPRRWQTLYTQGSAISRQLRLELNRPPQDREIAAKLDISLEEWQQVKLAVRNRWLVSLDAPIYDDEEGSASLGDVLPDPKYKSFQLAQEDRIRLQQALHQLEQRTRDVLEFVFLHDLTQKETADRLGISSVTVSRRVKQGLTRLRSLLGSTDET
ncbi:RNA polymerase sigma factor SigF [Halomicronema hongdechloris C2206]|uniref:RNA polymerase sigma factor SigF n=1 Tax=Halomicronema hongdechloris C2206 TaxID=1641165 RepID=A0A1Z3HI05_9CYAN|nr:RNA polymerase sigma factor SigF [Halomicronema hongdechloris]ASC69952.1 RNA polymerase sigma factor SigF [Halomicronema hongdechloris C2206]